MRFKIGVKMPVDLDPRMFVAFEAIERAWLNVAVLDDSLPEEPTITSWADSTHGPNSWHKRRGRAVDVRTKTLPRAKVPGFVLEMRERLTLLGFDVVLEDFNGPNEHLHVELDGRADQ